MLGVAAVFGAVIVLAGLLAVRQLSTTTEAAIEAGEDPTATAPPQPPDSIPPSAQPGEDGSGGFGDLPGREGGGGDADDADGAGEAPAPDAETPEDGGPETDGGEESTAPPTPEIEPLACPAGVDVVICDAAEFVQRTRGRPFRTFPVVEIMADEDFDRELLADFEDYRRELEVDGATLTALGLLSPEISLADTYRESLEVGVVGFYDPSTGQLVVRGDDFSLYSQLVLVHELVHAFDDQWFDLGREGFDDDADYGFSAVIEGNASRVENLWRSQLSDQDQLKLTQEEFTSLSDEDLDRLLAIPSVIQTLQGSPYLDGEVYVDWLASTGGEAAVDEALAEPPTSSEEILHPGTDRSVDLEVEVPEPPAGGTVIDEGRLGELVIRTWLGRLAAEGWAGDRFATWQDGELDCIVVDLIGDDEQQTIELDAGADAWAGLAPENRTVEPVTIDGRDGVRVTACA